MMYVLNKSPRACNMYTGNISLSMEEFINLKSGSYTHIRINFKTTRLIETWMLDNASVRKTDDGIYVLLPYSKKSFLFKNAA